MSDDSHDEANSARYALAAHIEADRVKILADYGRALDDIHSSIATDPLARQQTLAHAGQTLTEIVNSVRTGRVQVDESSLLAWDIGETRAASAMPARESWRAAMIFMETVVRSVIPHVSRDSLDGFDIVLVTLTRSITVGIREATEAYIGYLLDRISEAHIAERHRVARELHDRVGNGLSVAHRQLELFADRGEGTSVTALTWAERAQQALVESMESLRGLISDLRVGPPQSLEKSLVGYIDTVPTGGATLRLRVNGDETWLPLMFREESFLIIREAIRNALTHGAPGTVLVSVDIAPHELRAVVEDTGCGFDYARAMESGSSGLASMRERTALMDGSLSVLSQPGRGTQVELIVRLPEHRQDAEHAGNGEGAEDAEDAEGDGNA